MTVRAQPSPTRSVPRWVLPVATTAGLVLLVQLAVGVGVLPRSYVPPPSVIVGELAALVTEASTWNLVGSTIVAWATSLAVAIVLGTFGGVLFGSVRAVQAVLMPVIEFLRPIPSIAMIPLVVLTIGGGREGEVFLAGYAAFWQMLVAAVYATGSVDPVARDTAKAYGFSLPQRIAWVTLPSMLPGLLTGVRIASATALIITITSEILIGAPGLGQGLNLARSGGNLPRMYAYVVAIGLVGLVLNSGLSALSRRLLHWHPSGRSR